jgi:hypothetical protein
MFDISEFEEQFRPPFWNDFFQEKMEFLHEEGGFGDISEDDYEYFFGRFENEDEDDSFIGSDLERLFDVGNLVDTN